MGRKKRLKKLKKLKKQVKALQRLVLAQYARHLYCDVSLARDLTTIGSTQETPQ